MPLSKVFNKKPMDGIPDIRNKTTLHESYCYPIAKAWDTSTLLIIVHPKQDTLMPLTSKHGQYKNLNESSYKDLHGPPNEFNKLNIHLLDRAVPTSKLRLVKIEKKFMKCSLKQKYIGENPVVHSLGIKRKLHKISIACYMENEVVLKVQHPLQFSRFIVMKLLSLISAYTYFEEFNKQIKLRKMQTITAELQWWIRPQGI